MPYIAERTFREGTSTHQAWTQHRGFLHGLEARGLLIGGGTWEGDGGELLVLNVSDEVSLHRLLRTDPLARHSLVARSHVRQWHLAFGHPALTGRPETEDKSAGHGPLTPHESRIAQLMLDGHTNQAIAERLGVGCRAVEQHITRIYRKLSIQRRAQLANALHGATVHRLPIRPELLTA
ncbi:LuxR C-terminal-related transcriptional regulator [Kitasatospora sp. NPDC127059]|uniref:helix-turn-helix transcriptional regulator n=1 Tax=unclassified Kitasatospora TaxID=2633591 RepID=UPI003668FA96